LENAKKVEVGDVVLLFSNYLPKSFLHVINIVEEPTCVNGNGYTVTFVQLEIPCVEFNWLLNDDHLQTGEFYMGGVPMNLHVISSPVKQVIKKDASAKWEEKLEQANKDLDNLNTLF
jgi:hypothetical protein